MDALQGAKVMRSSYMKIQKLSFNRFLMTSICLGQILNFSVSRSVLADPPASPAETPESTGSGSYTPDVEQGSIKLRKTPIDLSAGGFLDSAGNKGVDLKASGNHDIFLWSMCDSDTDGHSCQSGPFRLGLGAEAQAQILSSGGVLSYHLASPSLGLVSAKFNNPDPDGRPGYASATASVELASLHYVDDANKAVGLKSRGLEIDAFRADGQVATKVNGVPVDVCGGFHFTSLPTGQVQVQGGPGPANGGALGVTANACLGVQIGKIFNLRDNGSVTYSWLSNPDPTANGLSKATDDLKVNNRVSASKILDSPVVLSWDHTYEATNSGDVVTTVSGATPGGANIHRGITTNTFSAGAAF